MKFKNELYILGGTALLVIIIFAVSSLDFEIKIGGKNKQNTSVSQTNEGRPQAPVVDSMDDHHKPQPSNSTAFDNLMGKEAPDFTLEDFGGKKITLSSLKGKNVVLFFNEGLMCYPACWNQIAAFGSDSEFSQKNTVVLSITVDPKGDWKDAVTKMPELAKATVLFDSDRAVSTIYGVMTLDSSMHRGQFPGHTYVIVDKDGVVRFARDDSQMAVRNKELLAEVAKLQ